MKCDCGYTAFYYQKFADNKKWDVYKCGHAMIEAKKKSKCDMYICEYISEINYTDKKSNKIYTENIISNPEIKYRQDLQKYIYLCKITQNFSKKYRWNYIANINFLLRKLNFDLYFEDTETLENLKQRIKKKYVQRTLVKNQFPIKLIDYPDYLAIIKKESIPLENKNKKTKIKKKKNLLLVEEEPEEDNNKEEILQSESESDSEDEEDNTFDIDNYDSGDDYDEFDDGGAFSD